MRNGRKQVIPRQTIWDVALQHHGSVDGLTALIDAGVFTGFDAQAVAGVQFVPGPVSDAQTLAYYQEHEVTPATHPGTVYSEGGAFANAFSNAFNID
jgi:hypothetical protein